MKKNIKESRVEKILGISFFAVGVLMLVIALVCAFFSWNAKRTSEEVTGTITEIYRSKEGAVSVSGCFFGKVRHA